MRMKRIMAVGLTCLFAGSMAVTPMAASLDSYEYDFSTGKETYHGSTQAGETEYNPYSEDNMQGYFLEDAQKPAAKKKGWFKKGKYRYYRMKNGKLCKKKWTKIGKYYYSFDSKGRMRTGNVKLSKGYSAYFSTKTGRYVNSKVNVTVTKKGKDYIIAKSSTGEKYSIPLKNVKVYDQKGQKVRSTALKKGSKIQVLFKGSILETSPAQFKKIVKIKIR